MRENYNAGRRNLLIIFLFFSGGISVYGQTWVVAGAPGFSAAKAWYTSLAIDHAGTPYVAYQDYSSSQKATVEKFNGSSWVGVGSPGFSGSVAYFTSLAIDTTGTPYVAFEDFANSYKVSVMKYNGTSWVYVGAAGFSAGASSYSSLAIDRSGTLYVAFEDFNSGKRATVMKYNGTAWVNVGVPGFSDTTAIYTNIAIDTGGVPYVVYSDGGYSQKATVMKYDGTSWVALGGPGISAGGTSYTSMAINADTPYVLYVDNASGQKATVMKYNGSSWVAVGSPGFSAGVASYTSLAINAGGIPYVAYYDAANSGHATVMKYNSAAWVNAGLAGFSDSTATYTSIAINNNGTPYVAYSDYADTQRATVMVLDTALAPIAGTKTLCVSGTTTLSDLTTGGVWSSHNTSIATVGSSGIVTGVAAGTDKISYTVGSNSAIVTVTVYPIPAVGSITGASSLCADSSVALTDATSGGVWSSSNIAIASANPGGTVVGHTGGTVTISYSIVNICGSAYATHILTLNPLPNPGVISGVSSVCLPSMITLSDTVAGGTGSWTSSNTAVATITSAGFIASHAAGTTSISYAVTNSCGVSYATKIFTVNVSPVAGSITGTSVLCAGSTTSLTDGAAGGVWSSSNNAIASVNSTGLVSGHAGGTATISYTVANSCGSVFATNVVTVNPLPNAGSITGANTVCTSSTITLSDVVTSGIWSSDNTGVAAVNSAGVVSGVSLGTATISYTLTNSCGPSAATKVITVVSLANAGSITGASILCADSSTMLADTTASNAGVWSSSNTAIATVNSTGVVSGHTGGTATISYAVTNSCGTVYATMIITLNPLPNPGSITGPDTVCASGVLTLSDAITGGTWSSSNGTIATVDMSTGIVSGHVKGTTTITYTVTNGCGATFTTKAITVDSLKNPGSITGITSLCADTVITLTDNVSGGIWSSSNTSVATVDAVGMVSGHLGGTTTISYAVTNLCGIAAAAKIITVNPLPTAGNITGADTVCKSSFITLGETIAGGVWSSSNNSIVKVDTAGNVNGVTAGSATISYKVTNSCGTAIATQIMAVNVLPNAGKITGTDTVCSTEKITLADTVAGGVWISGDTATATVDSAGVVSGVSVGTAIISYAITNGCGTAAATKPITVHACINGSKNLGKILLFPDPNTGHFTAIVFTTIPENTTLIITNMFGRKVNQILTTTNIETTINIDGPPGIYCITAIKGSGTVSANVQVE